MSTFSTIILMGDCIMLLFTYKEILNILGEYIKKNTSWAVDGMPGDDKPLMDHTTTTMERLLHLECQITQVEEVLGRVPRCYIITISCMVITVCVMLITCFFNIIKNGFQGYLLLANFNSITLLYFICSSSQMFINQVEDAVRCLRLCSARTEDVIIKGQVYRLIQYLGAIEKVNFHGWFSLTHGTMVSLGSLVVTYLVVMLQVA
ncbi:hypothetical protein Pcinc_009557 [Petrolisthes cinctipes]|uniref:Gustatory receptor n=1 Tax=Petrolisthes cinctipes TaxID=88211 RepID=A0AAE1KYC2_PETCI|nr:hypothetical protein Pcinc_009557 [Petrolisthes cinctipes]